MRKDEQKLWDTMRRRKPSSIWLQRVENVVGEGMPDVYVSDIGAWIELKAPRGTGAVLLDTSKLRQSQINWHAKAYVHQIKSYILIRTTKTGNIYLVPGEYAYAINLCTADTAEDMSVANHWEGIWEVLT